MLQAYEQALRLICIHIKLELKKKIIIPRDSVSKIYKKCQSQISLFSIRVWGVMKEVLVLQWLTHAELIDNSKYNLQFYQGHVFDITIYLHSDGQAYVNDVLEIF